MVYLQVIKDNANVVAWLLIPKITIVFEELLTSPLCHPVAATLTAKSFEARNSNAESKSVALRGLENISNGSSRNIDFLCNSSEAQSLRSQPLNGFTIYFRFRAA